MKTYLVEIRLKDWIAGENRVLAYEEVKAENEIAARYKGYDQFKDKTLYSPSVKRDWVKTRLTYADICAPDCVCLD